MPYLTIKAEAGPLSSYDEVPKVLQEGLDLANKLNTIIQMKLDDVDCYCYPNGSIDKLISGFNKAYKNHTEMKMAIS